ncbi:MAG: hypothetical protein U1E36_05020 [Rickettsiales bacterium]
MDVTGIVALAFFIFVIALYKPIARFLTKSLDQRSARIANELAEAERLREEAQATLVAYQKRQREVNEEAEQILKAAKSTALKLQEEAKAQLKKSVEARIAQANEKIAQEEQKAVQEVHKRVVEIATQAAKTLITDDYQDEANDLLTQLALKDANRVLH